MNKKLGLALIAVVLIGGGWWLYNRVLGPTAPPSGPITAIPLNPEDRGAEPAEEPAGGPSPQALLPSAGTSEPAPASLLPAPSGPAPAGARTFTIRQDASETRFKIDEVLRGQPTTAVGTTNQVAGQIALDLSDLSSARVGVIQVNARTLATDDNRRNQAIRNWILNTNAYEFITFAPTRVIGLSGSAAPGDQFQFQMAGDLTIRDVTRPVVFEVKLRIVSDNEIAGEATTQVSRADFNLTVPNLPFIANVSDVVRLEVSGAAVATP